MLCHLPYEPSPPCPLSLGPLFSAFSPLPLFLSPLILSSLHALSSLPSHPRAISCLSNHLCPLALRLFFLFLPCPFRHFIAALSSRSPHFSALASLLGHFVSSFSYLSLPLPSLPSPPPTLHPRTTNLFSASLRPLTFALLPEPSHLYPRSPAWPLSLLFFFLSPPFSALFPPPPTRGHSPLPSLLCPLP
jgi:hypothetical protein